MNGADCTILDTKFRSIFDMCTISHLNTMSHFINACIKKRDMEYMRKLEDRIKTLENQ